MRRLWVCFVCMYIPQSPVQSFDSRIALNAKFIDQIAYAVVVVVVVSAFVFVFANACAQHHTAQQEKN